ncbi:hypothetical protein COLO4_20742 [Corchorus olitorius]|uniref:Uncharacterized protein n=1 Tax=Corchorus olitorius TaxID=93759 RepID=A0A1R3IX92_9ROSI|nr:hypothetical protein COLO4_37494 [Corchorus olitorius]OMO87209.1 hypothetical protein COLO4_20742 [Corchorus olitorius]
MTAPPRTALLMAASNPPSNCLTASSLVDFFIKLS